MNGEIILKEKLKIKKTKSEERLERALNKKTLEPKKVVNKMQPKTTLKKQNELKRKKEIIKKIEIKRESL